MHDSELKKILSETCPVLPGQEARAWKTLQSRIYGSTEAVSRWSWLLSPTWPRAVFALAAICVSGFVANSVLDCFQPVSFASADSEAPGIYATSFYSHTAKAQVVWLNGLAPATDKPTYLDPTTRLAPSHEPSKTPGDPNSL